jgi:putative peptide zinc metalloprotease protein
MGVGMIWSEHWHAVRFLRPRLRDGVQPVHRLLRGRHWVLLADPLTQRFHRLPPSVWQVLQLLDGTRTLDQVWTVCCALPASGAQHASAVSQDELVRLLANLHANDLLQSQVAPDAGEVLERYERQSSLRRRQSWMNPLNIRLPLLHPDAWFERQAGLARRLASWPALLLWLVLVLPAAVLAWQHWEELTANLSDRVLAADNVVLLWFVYPLVKAVHEWAHGMAVKARGGAVREIGVMFMIFTPVPYVDATSSYRFPSKGSRVLVAAAGIMAELALGACAMAVWLLAQPGLVTAVAFNVVLIAGVSTLLVNGNPLMRYDGYFALCDLIEVPNLAQRSSQYWVYLIDRYGFGSSEAEPPLQAQGESLLLFAYGLVSPLYRLFITFGLIWFVASQYRFVGAVMALLALWSAVALPLWAGWKHLRQGAVLAQRRELALRRSTIALIAAVGFFTLLPLPFHSVHHGVVWVPDAAIVHAGAAGRISSAAVEPGTRVAAGQPLFRLDDPAALAEVALAAGALAEARAQLRHAEIDSPAKAPALRGEVESRNAKLVDAESRVAELEPRSPTAGRWVPKAETELVGRHVKRGEVVGYVVTGPSDRVRAAVPQEDMELIRSRLEGVEVRLAQAPRTTLEARLSRRVPGGEYQLVSPALGTAGGGEIAVDPGKSGGDHTIKRVFDLEIQLARPTPLALFGDRAYVRFDLGSAPLGWQWFLRLRQMFLARLDV